MENKMKDKYKKDEFTGQNICFYCKHFFCTEYHYPRHRMVCSGILPKWDFLYFLMREVKATDTCKKFILHDMFKKR